MTSYHCAVSNKFGFASDDDEFEDPRELIQKVTELAAKKKVEEKIAVKPAQPAKKPEATTAPVKTENSRGRGGRGRGRGGAGRPRDGNDASARTEDRFGENRRGGPRRGGERGERGGDRPERGGDRPERGAGRPAGRGGRGGFSAANNTSSDDVAKENSFEEQRGEDRPRRRGGFSLGGAGGSGRGGGGRGRGRPFDRQSGSDRTGVRSFDKKDGHGKGNWGDNKDELIGETENIAPEDAVVEPAAPGEKTAEEIALDAENAELAKQKTLKEFKALTIVDAPKFNTRKAGEGATDNFGKLVPIKKEIIPDREEEEVVVIRKESRKQVVDISITFADNNRGGIRNERGDRSDYRSERGERTGRGGRGARTGNRGGRSGNTRSSAPFVNSSDAFPALGAR